MLGLKLIHARRKRPRWFGYGKCYQKSVRVPSLAPGYVQMPRWWWSKYGYKSDIDPLRLMIWPQRYDICTVMMLQRVSVYWPNIFSKFADSSLLESLLSNRIMPRFNLTSLFMIMSGKVKSLPLTVYSDPRNNPWKHENIWNINISHQCSNELSP